MQSHSRLMCGTYQTFYAVGSKSGSREHRNIILALGRTMGKPNQCGQAPVVPQ